jgi:amidase
MAARVDEGAGAASGLPEYRSAIALVEALAAREVSSVELLEAAIARIEAVDGRVNAVVIRDFERARVAARAADAALARGERRPLLGLPMTVKEAFSIPGLPTSWGDATSRDRMPDFESLAVTRLKAAGAIVLGKTNVPVMLEDWQSYNPIHGVTGNPWDLARTPGGSSGGSAAALAAGYVALELGSDIGGSLRAPAHYCGVFAHKPSHDLVPMRGLVPPGVPNWPGRVDLAVAGPMARSAADLALALDILAGPDSDGGDGIGYRLELPNSRHAELKNFRVLLIDAHPMFPTAASVRDALQRLAEGLGRAGCRVTRSDAKLPDLAETARTYVYLLSAFSAADLPAEIYRQIKGIAESLNPEDRSLDAARMRGFTGSHRDWVQVSRIRNRLRQHWRALFAEFDVVLCPAMPGPAFVQDHSEPSWRRRIDIDGATHPYVDQIVWASMATSMGLPATVAPISRSDTGLPIGVQIVGPYLEDRTTIAFAGLIERHFGGFVAPPAM